MIDKGMVRNRAFLDLAHFAPCMLQIHGACESGKNPSVPAHSNLQRHGRGAFLKSHDCFTVPACTACHLWLDFSNKATREEKDEAFMRAMERWLEFLFRHEWLEVVKQKAASVPTFGTDCR